MKVSEEGMEAIVLTSEGDLRKAITSLQSCARLRGDVEIAKDDVYEISGVIPEKYLEVLLECCQLNSYDRVQGFVDDMICEGFSGHQLINQLHDYVWWPTAASRTARRHPSVKSWPRPSTACGRLTSTYRS